MGVQAWETKDLRASLLRQLARTHWVAVPEVQINDGREGRVGRVDVLAMLKSRSRTLVHAFEIKISRADLLADLRAEKWRLYIGYAPLWFAMPAGLAHAKEIPLEAGIILRSDAGWRRIRAPKAGPETPPLEVMRRLVMAADRTGAQPAPRRATVWELARQERSNLARKAAQIIIDTEAATQQLENLREELMLTRGRLRREQMVPPVVQRRIA